jgi:transcriptional regulator with XRE-family HTH domain
VLSDVVADQLVRLRRKHGLTREQLAKRLADNGAPGLTSAALANIETGRRDSEGRRRREVTVDELVALAAVLDESPLLLVFPLGADRFTEVLPGRTVSMWPAAQWFAGRAGLPVAPSWEPGRAEARRRFGDAAHSVAVGYRLPIRLYEAHERALDELWAIRGHVEDLRRQAQTQNGDVARNLRAAEGNLTARASILRDLRQQMRDHGMDPPTLDSETAAVLGEEVPSSPVGESS